MGLADMFSAEDRVDVKFSDFYQLIKQAAMSEIMMNGIKTRIPHAHIEAMWDGKNSELEQYRACGMSPEEIGELCKMQEADHKALYEYEMLGVSPEQIKEIDKAFTEKCKELAQHASNEEHLMQENEQLRKSYTKEHNELNGWRCLGMPIEEVRQLRFSLDHAQTQKAKLECEAKHLKDELEKLKETEVFG